MSAPEGSLTGPIWVGGHPVAKGSMKCVARHAPGQRARLVPDKRADPDGWVPSLGEKLRFRAPELAATPADGAVELHLTFFLERPKTTSFPDAPIGHGTGDLDKLVRMVGDAIGGSKTDPGLITDDSRVAKIVAEKLYAPEGTNEGALIELRPYVAPDPSRPTLVRLLAGKFSGLIGSITDTADLPALLRRAADRLEGRL